MFSFRKKIVEPFSTPSDTSTDTAWVSRVPASVWCRHYFDFSCSDGRVFVPHCSSACVFPWLMVWNIFHALMCPRLPVSFGKMFIVRFPVGLFFHCWVEEVFYIVDNNPFLETFSLNDSFQYILKSSNVSPTALFFINIVSIIKKKCYWDVVG